MTTTTYYNLNIVEGTDIVNPLIVDNPNYAKIDEEMHNNAVAGVTLATEIANATVHAITRENSDCSVIRFIATSRWKAGDTATVDGVPVTALLPNGETLPDGAYVINANVLCILTGTNLTVYLGGNKVENASDIIYHDTNVGSELDALNVSVEQINTRVEQINSNLGIDLLWTNPSPTSIFEPQTLNIDLSSYKWVIIDFKFANSVDYFETSFAPIDGQTHIGHVVVHRIHYRCFIASSDKIVFDNGVEIYTYNTAASSPSDAIPVKIFGVK